MKYYLYFFIIAVLSSCISCRDSETPAYHAASYIVAFNSHDSVQFEFPFRKNSETGQNDSTRLFERRRVFKKLGFQNLEKGADSVHIRVIYSWSLLEELLVLDLKNVSGEWSAEVSKVRCHFNSKINQTDSFTRKVVEDYPGSGWLHLIDNLFELGVLTLEDEQKLPKDSTMSVADGVMIDFEIATRIRYRSYGYSNPDMKSSAIKQIRQVSAIKELLWNEFEQLTKLEKQIFDDFEKRSEEQKRKIEEKYGVQ